MAQVSLYIEDSKLDALRERAAREGVSLSRYVASQLDANSAQTWSERFFDLYGALPDIELPTDDPASLRLDDACDWFMG